MSQDLPDSASAAPVAALPAPGLPEPALAARSLAHILRPLARLMIDHGLQLPDVVELLKQALVVEADSSFGLAEKDSTDSRIALFTGFHRKDVRRLREAAPQPDAATPMASVAASVVARWISEPRYLNAEQSARPLARTPRRSAPGEPDFTSLVNEVSSDVGARAVLDELARLGVVQIDDEGYVSLLANAFVPKEGLRESFQFLATNVGCHLATAAHNLSPQRQGTPHLEQSAFSADLCAAEAVQLETLARKLWVAALQQFLQFATVAEQRSAGTDGPHHTVRFGVYFHDTVQPPAAGPELAPAGKARRSRKNV